ncbi:MAG: ABC transporter permease [Erysipelotrichaceae bacterium]|nr:ABC transporter permease [Erysipelotrichaceae bacterium]
MVISIMIAGALAGMGAGLYYLNPGIEYRYISQYASLPAYGFSGIASAFLANCNPVGVVFSSILIRYLNMGGDYLVKVGFNRYVADIVIAVIIYMAGFTRIIKEFITKHHKAHPLEAKVKEESK